VFSQPLKHSKLYYLFMLRQLRGGRWRVSKGCGKRSSSSSAPPKHTSTKVPMYLTYHLVPISFFFQDVLNLGHEWSYTLFL
jgi:hypothetical protein